VSAPNGSFTGVRVLVTGGASGLGLGTARLLASRGAGVVVLDRQAPPDGALPAGVGSVLADVADDAAVRAAVEQAADRLGGLDVVVNNAGTGAVGTVADGDDEEWLRVYDVNVLGAVRVSRAALPYLRRSEHACIVMTCSVAAVVGLPQRALYSATKGALTALTLAMAADHVADGIRVNAVHPGTADTPWVSRLLDGAADPARSGGRWRPASRSAGSSAWTRSPRPSPTSPPRSAAARPPPCSRWTAACEPPAARAGTLTVPT
jgi:NAD(P)-dependent dehydrogenase (short-subunit alcohol dehydrogenase family)